MGPEKQQDFNQEQRAEFARQFRRHQRFQIFLLVGGILLYFVHMVYALSADIWDESWGYGLLPLFGGGVMYWSSAAKYNRCPACDHFFNRGMPTRTRKICPGCGSQLID